MNTSHLAKYFFIATFLVSLFGCDVIDEPYMTGQEEHNGNNDVTVRKILLEYFTGHQCLHCPPGSEMASTLKDYYGDRLVVMSIHAGFFARVTPDEFSYDFTTDAGDELFDFFDITIKPIGIVNRTEYEGSILLSPSAWAEAIEEFIDDTPQFHIEINIQHHANDNELEVCIDVSSLVNSDCLYYISAFIIEDGIIKPQRTNDPNYPDGIIMDYEHNNVLRKGVNGALGDQLNDSPVTSDSQFINNYRVNIDDEWVLENTSVIAFVYHFPTNEVIQVEIASVSDFLE